MLVGRLEAADPADRASLCSRIEATLSVGSVLCGTGLASFLWIISRSEAILIGFKRNTLVGETDHRQRRRPLLYFRHSLSVAEVPQFRLFKSAQPQVHRFRF
jgi:hypothetical protein